MNEDDWLDNLSLEQWQSIMRGLEQAEKGETILHEEALLRLGIW